MSDGSAPGVAAVLFPATPTECQALADALGQGWEVRDGRRVDRAAVVFLRACSTQTIAGVRTRFPDAHLVVVEAPLGGSTYVSGRVRRALRAGVDQYLGLNEDGTMPRMTGMQPTATPDLGRRHPRRTASLA